MAALAGSQHAVGRTRFNAAGQGQQQQQQQQQQRRRRSAESEADLLLVLPLSSQQSHVSADNTAPQLIKD